MFIQESTNDDMLKTLNLACFPKQVLEFQESQDLFEQLVFIDYQLQLLIQNEFDGSELVPAVVYTGSGEKGAANDKLSQLIGYAESITNNYNDVNKDYQDKLYCTIILAHLYYLNSQDELLNQVLKSISVNNEYSNSSKLTTNQNDFLNYLICRYNVLIGITDGENSYKLWIDYLTFKERPFNKSDVAANYWLDIMFKYLSLHISDNGTRQLSFTDDVMNLKFKDNKTSLIRYCNFLINFRFDININKIIDKSFKQDYSKFLNKEINVNIKTTNKNFPNASNSDPEIDDYVSNLYSTLGKKSFKLISGNVSKKFLISLMERSYQSETILASFIKVLMDLEEYDEAFAALKTYIGYVEKNEEQNDGNIKDILSIIDVLSTCLIKFNPLNSVKKDIFKFTKEDLILTTLQQFSKKLLRYLAVLEKCCNLNYDADFNNQFKSNDLSFLYHKYNINILLSDRSELIELISSSWYALGYLRYHLLVFQTPTTELIRRNKEDLIVYYKNALIVNSTGNLNILLSYALTLSYFSHLQSSFKLCKFILKKYPESFQTWNLLALVSSTVEIQNEDEHKLKELEKFINNGLNIAGIFIIKCKNDEIDIPINIKYEIMQLKLTQLAIWEMIHGANYILNYLSEVFILYYELFNVKYEGQIQSSEKDTLVDNKWSHRPTFIDPKSTKKVVNDKTEKKELAKDNIKRISKLKSTGSKLNGTSHQHSHTTDSLTTNEKKLLQGVWLWASKIYYKAELYDESEQCIIEAENVYKPNVKTFIQLGYLTSRHQKFLSLQEFEKSLEKLEEMNRFNRLDYLLNLLGLAKLFLVDDQLKNSLFISVKDFNSGLIRLKNHLEKFLNCWPLGYNCIEIWYYLSLVYEKIDDKVLLEFSLNKCIELQNYSPARNFCNCDENLVHY